MPEKTCLVCYGTGKRPKICPRCRSAGWEQESCGFCEGTGVLDGEKLTEDQVRAEIERDHGVLLDTSPQIPLHVEAALTNIKILLIAEGRRRGIKAFLRSRRLQDGWLLRATWDGGKSGILVLPDTRLDESSRSDAAWKGIEEEVKKAYRSS